MRDDRYVVFLSEPDEELIALITGNENDHHALFKQLGSAIIKSGFKLPSFVLVTVDGRPLVFAYGDIKLAGGPNRTAIKSNSAFTWVERELTDEEASLLTIERLDAEETFAAVADCHLEQGYVPADNFLLERVPATATAEAETRPMPAFDDAPPTEAPALTRWALTPDGDLGPNSTNGDLGANSANGSFDHSYTDRGYNDDDADRTSMLPTYLTGSPVGSDVYALSDDPVETGAAEPATNGAYEPDDDRADDAAAFGRVDAPAEDLATADRGRSSEPYRFADAAGSNGSSLSGGGSGSYPPPSAPAGAETLVPSAWSYSPDDRPAADDAADHHGWDDHQVDNGTLYGTLTFDDGQSIEVRQSIYVGRYPTKHGLPPGYEAVVVTSDHVSRIHWELVCDGRSVSVADLGSTTGTSVRRSDDVQPVRLSAGHLRVIDDDTVITFGDRTARFRVA